MSQIQERATEITEYTERTVAILELVCQLSSLHQRLKWQLADCVRLIAFSVISVANEVLS